MITPHTKHQNYEVMLTEYAAGTLDEGCALIVATHMTLCPETRDMVEGYEAVGGELLLECECVEIRGSMLDQLMARIEEIPAPVIEIEPHYAQDPIGISLPRPLQNYLLSDSQTPVKWKKVFSGMYAIDLPLTDTRTKARLIKMDPGASVPEHGHGGQELTLILDGAMIDEHGRYEVGDLIIEDVGHDHTPVADAEKGCICLAVTCAPIKLKGWASLLNPFLRT